MHARAVLALVTLAALLATTLPVAARCAQSGTHYVRVGSGTVSSDAPVVLLGAEVDRDSRDLEARPTRARLGTQALTLEVLAPGLVRASSSSPVAPGTYTLDAARAHVAVTVAAPAPYDALPAPDVASLVTIAERRSGAATSATLRAAIPASALAVIVSSAGAPIAWAPIEDRSAPSLTVARVPRCAQPPDDYTVPRAGTIVTLRWVDRHGRLSPPSSPITVSAP